MRNRSTSIDCCHPSTGEPKCGRPASRTSGRVMRGRKKASSPTSTRGSTTQSGPNCSSRPLPGAWSPRPSPSASGLILRSTCPNRSWRSSSTRLARRSGTRFATTCRRERSRARTRSICRRRRSTPVRARLVRASGRAGRLPTRTRSQSPSQVTRDGFVVWKGETSTSLLHRRFDDLVEHLYRNCTFPDGAVLTTGTGLVPDMSFNLAPGDVAEVAIEGIGTLVNEVRHATDAQLRLAHSRPRAQPARLTSRPPRRSDPERSQLSLLLA